MPSTTAEDYYQERAVPPGSALHYALLFAPPQQRPALAALAAFHREVTQAGRGAREAAAARLRLQWWRDEVQRIFDGGPRHPLSRVLGETAAAAGLTAEQFLEVIAGAEMDLERYAYPRFQELTLYYHRTASMPCMMAARILGYGEPRTLRYAHYLGTALGLAEAIRRARLDAVDGRLYFPADELQEHGVTLEDLATGADTPGVRALFARQLIRCREYHRMAMAQLAEADRLRQCSGIVLGRIAMAVMDKVERDGYPRPGRRYALPPIAKLWIAWRTCRRERRRAGAAARARP